jgi:divalent metal cation (Fe/Co/Zn/Cd) transporter
LTTAFDARQRREIASRGRLLQYVTIAWNSAESVVALAAGFVAGSIALVGFGFDSAIEVTSSVAALWWLGREADEVGRARAEQRTMRIIGCCFLLLAAFVCYEAVHALVERKSPDHSTVGIVLAVLSLAVMPTLAHFKRRIASKLTSGALEAEARQTDVCAWLSAVLLAGLGLTPFLKALAQSPMATVPAQS